MKTVVKITDKAKKGTFDNCKLYGGLENSGQDMKFVKTSIGLREFTKNHPILYGSLSAIIGGVFILIVEYIFFK